MRESNSPMILWNYAIERRSLVHNAVPRPFFQAQGITPHECTFGNKSDISNICNFGWCEWVCYRDFSSFPENKEKLGRMLGPCKNEVNEMHQSILASSSYAITRRAVRSLRNSELRSETEKRKRRIFDDIILKKLGDSVAKPTNSNAREHVPYSDGVDADSVKLPEDNEPVIPDGTADFEKAITDQWTHAELNLPQGELLRKATVIGQTKDGNVDLTVSHDPNPFLNTLTYDVDFSDGEIKEHSANVIAENMCSQVDEDGCNIQKLDSIVDHSKDINVVDKSDMRLHTKSGQQHLRHTASGWSLLILWKNGEEECMPLNRLKQFLPLEIAEFAVARGIDDKTAFKWWFPYTLRR